MTPLLLNLAFGNMVCCTLVFPIVAHNALTSVSYLSVPHLCTAFKIALHSFCGNSLCTVSAISVIQCIAVLTNGVSTWLNRFLLIHLIWLTCLVPILGGAILSYAFDSIAHSERICVY